MMKALILLVISINLLVVSSQNSVAQKNALVNFYNSLDSSSKTTLNWNINISLCGQRGIICVNNLVSTIILSNLGLNGTIPSSFSNINTLRNLTMANNNIYGTLPSSLSVLTALDTMSLELNQLTGSVPTEFALFGSNFRRLILNNNFLESRPQYLTMLVNARFVFLDSNHFDCPPVNYAFYNNDDHPNALARCNTHCPPGKCPSNQYCRITGTTYNAGVCRTPTSCNAIPGFPTSLPQTTVVGFPCPANQYGNVTRFCYGDNLWFPPTSSFCQNCPATATSPFGTPTISGCICPTGFRISGNSCVDIDECAENTFTCNFGAICMNTPGSYNCVCGPGFEGDGVNCTDINECESTNPCISNCFNTIGSFLCDCGQGFVLFNSTCLPDEHLAQTLTLDPFLIWNFNFFESGADTSGNGVGVTLNGNSIVPFYQKNSESNMAVFLRRNFIISNSTFNIQDSFAVEVIFNIATAIETEIIALTETPVLDPFFSPFRVVISNVRRVQVYDGLKLVGTSTIALQIEVTYYLIVSVQSSQVVLWVNGARVGTFPYTIPTGQFYLQIGRKFRGYIDEVNFLNTPLFGADAPLRDDYLECTITCPNACVNQFDGPVCQ